MKSSYKWLFEGPLLFWCVFLAALAKFICDWLYEVDIPPAIGGFTYAEFFFN